MTQLRWVVFGDDPFVGGRTCYAATVVMPLENGAEVADRIRLDADHDPDDVGRLVYVGQTTSTLAHRAAQHHHDATNPDRRRAKGGRWLRALHDGLRRGGRLVLVASIECVELTRADAASHELCHVERLGRWALNDRTPGAAPVPKTPIPLPPTPPCIRCGSAQSIPWPPPWHKGWCVGCAEAEIEARTNRGAA